MFSSSAIPEYRLHPPGDPRGVSCDEQGPSLGPIRLIVRTDEGFAPRPADELQQILDATFGHAFDCTSLMRGLKSVARALNDGDLARAMMATLLMRLPVLSESEATRAANAVAMSKASPDDPKHPGWPKGAPNSQGGKYRPKNGDADSDAVTREVAARARLAVTRELGDEAKIVIRDRVKSLLRRQEIRELLSRVLTWRRVVRLVGEAALDEVPIVDIASGIATVADVTSMVADYAELKFDAKIAEEFANNGPYTLGQLRPEGENRTFPSFSALKKTDLVKFYGPAKAGYEFHHIVEQNAEGSIPVSLLNSTDNVVLIPKYLHEEITSMTVNPAKSPDGISRRESLQGASYEERRAMGLLVMRDIGILE